MAKNPFTKENWPSAKWGYDDFIPRRIDPSGYPGERKEGCKASGCKEHHTKHHCRLCKNENSDHLCRNCPLRSSGEERKVGCKVPECNEHHTEHFCKWCLTAVLLLPETRSGQSFRTKSKPYLSLTLT